MNKTPEIKGPFSYSGNKYKIYKKHLSDIMCNFQKVHEPFLGSGACLYNSNSGGIGIDIDKNLIMLHNSLNDKNLLSLIENTYKNYFPSGRNKESYNKLRFDFNESYKINGTTIENVHLLHILIQLSFNSLLRFSKNGYNVPFGMKEVDFNRIKLHQQIVCDKDITFINGNYFDLDLNKIDKTNDVIYFDPPYIAAKFQYSGWKEDEEIKLLDYLDMLNNNGYKFILSNTFLHRGIENKYLIDWSKKYITKPINMQYNSWSASVTSVKHETNTIEVIIQNF
jgi:DNA adenine methylase/adenine-specific DNA-methyltransferase